MPAKRRSTLTRNASRMARLAPLALGIALALGAAGVRAQSLFEVYEAARGFDASYLAARALADSAVYRAEQVHALRRPSVGLTAGVSRSTLDTGSADRTTRTTSASIDADQSLFNRQNDADIAKADKGVEAAKADVLIAEQDLILRVSTAYFDVLTAQETLASAQANRRAISEQLASAKRNFEVGTATITDTREAQARFDLATAQELQAENDLQTKRLALDTIVGRSAVAPKPLATPVELAPLVPGSVEQWVSTTETAPSVLRSRIAYDVAQLETRKARAGHLPTVGLSAGVGRSNNRIDPASAVDPSGNRTSTSVGIALNLPLFTGFSVQNRIKETLLLEEQARENLESARRLATQNTRTAFFGAQSLQAQVMAFEAALSSSQLALEATQLGYRVGVRVNLDVLNAQTQLFNARRDLAKARNDVLVNSLRLRQAAGTLSAEDVLKVNQLLAK
ncbi:TolC family outer membrane protein [Piscinibacter sp. XHJ-5]|uniref:TolC family outer membrane protein n=1 Tax=Piscinibacter sp. XHJ-5 TaxID=3037797 RepID=UPI0024528D85|nr:TolC family outer membrane protein [Piscinibacter sp. XHJ-5]